MGGWCNSHNMKMIFRVAENEEEDNHVMVEEVRRPLPSPTVWAKLWREGEGGSIVKKYEEVIQQKEDKYLYRYTSQQNDSGQKSGRFNNVSGRGGRVSGRAGDARERSGRGSALPLTSGGSSSSSRARCLTHGPFLAIVLPLLTVIMKR